MDLEGGFSVIESVEDNEEITDGTRNLGNFGGSKVRNNESSVVENNDNVQKDGETSDLKLDATRRGHGLKKWRRIRRDANKGGEIGVATGLMGPHELSNSVVNPSKRMQYSARKQKSEGSISSTDAVVRSFDGFALRDDSGLGFSRPFAVETDSENSEDRSSKSSTAASAPKGSRAKSSSGKNSTHTVQRGGQLGKGRIENSSKGRGVRVKIEKEDSHSSLESDSRSSNFVFMQGTSSTNNGVRNERLKGYDGEDEDEVQGGSGQEVTYGFQGGYSRDGEEAHEEFSPEDGVAESSSGIKEERRESHGSLSDQDPLVESLSAMDCVKEALEKEVLKYKELGKDVPVDDSILDLCTEFIDVEQKLQTTSSRQLPCGESEDSSLGVESDVVERENRDLEVEIEELFKQKIENEVECMVLSRSANKMRAASAVDQITVMEEQASEQTVILDKLEHAENKAAMLKKEAEKLERICEDIASVDETLKLQNRVCKYSSCFFVQLVMLALALAVFVYQLSPNYDEVVPT
ncbi:hypothetical protein ABFS83_13G150500 [Erythranthe nasuta]